jgi:hypothetical protein
MLFSNDAVECARVPTARAGSENGQIAAAERLTAKASQYFDDADLIEAAEWRAVTQETD